VDVFHQGIGTDYPYLVFCLPLNTMTALASYKSRKSGSDAQRILVNVLFVLIFFLNLCPSILDESNFLGV
jgi:hypothetical protein